MVVLLAAGWQGGLEPRLVLSAAPTAPQFPAGMMILEASTIASWGLGMPGVVAKRWDEEPGRIAAAALLVLYGASWLVPERWKPWNLPSDSVWVTSHPWWWVALALGVLVAGISSWDSRRRGAPTRLGYPQTTTT